MSNLKKDKHKIMRITTVPQSLRGLLKGQLKYMSENGFEVLGVSAPGEELQDVETEEDIRTVAIVMTRSITPLKDLKALWQLYRLIRRERPDIVHTHTPKAGTLGMMAAWMAGVHNRLHTIAGLPLLEATGKKRKLLDLVEKITYGCATKVYPNSFGLQEIVLENKFTGRNKLKVIGKGSSNGINTGYFDPILISAQQKLKLRASLGFKPDDFVFVFVGRMVGDKGLNELVAAFLSLYSTVKTNRPPLPATVPPRPTSVKLLLVGSPETELDPLAPETLKYMETDSNIRAVGFQKDVRPYFAISDALAFPSYREGFPNVVLQAGAMELPAIVTDINGCNEIITNGENGWIVPFKNVDRLRERMRWCIRNQKELKTMGLKSRKYIRQNYEQKFVWEELLKEYRNLLMK